MRNKAETYCWERHFGLQLTNCQLLVNLAVRTVHPLEEGLRHRKTGWASFHYKKVRTVHPLEEGLRHN